MYFCWMCYSQYIPNNLLSLMSQMETNSQRQSLLSIPLNGAEQKISQRRRLKLSLNDDIFHTGWFVPTIPDYFLFEPPSKYISVSFHWMVVSKDWSEDDPNEALQCIFHYFLSSFKPSIMYFSFAVCVKRSIFRGFPLEASTARETTWC